MIPSLQVYAERRDAGRLQKLFGKRSASVTALVACLLGLQSGVICDQSVNPAANEVVGVGGTSSSGGLSKQHTSFVSSGPVAASVGSVGGNDEYRTTHFYPSRDHRRPQAQYDVNWNRDSYSDAASDFGYNQPQPSPSIPGAVYSPAYGAVESDGYDDDSFGVGGGGLGGLGGLGGIAGILGIKGIKGLGILGVLKAAVPVLAILLPALLLLPLIFLFFPVPVITVPAGQRRLVGGFNFGEITGKMSSLARSVLESDKCIERISCEMSRVSKGTFFERTLKRVIPRFEPHMPQTLKRIARVYMEQPKEACSRKYTCYLMDDSSSAKKSAP